VQSAQTRTRDCYAYTILTLQVWQLSSQPDFASTLAFRGASAGSVPRFTGHRPR